MKAQKIKTMRVALGLFFIFLGVIFLGIKAGWISDSVRALIFSWPAFLLLFACYLLMQTRRNYIFIFLLLGIGGFLMLKKLFAAFPQLTLFGLDFNGLEVYLAPFFLLFIGCYFIFTPYSCKRGWRKRQEHRKERMNFDKSGDGFYEKNVVFANSEQIFLESEFCGGEINVVLGSAVLDLRRAILPVGGSTLKINVVMGDVILYAPATWNVVSNVDIILGDFKNKRLMNNESTDAPLLTLNGSVILGNATLM